MKLSKGFIFTAVVFASGSSMAMELQSFTCPQLKEFQTFEIDKALLNLNCEQLVSLDRAAVELKKMFGLDHLRSPLLRLRKAGSFDASYMSFSNRLDLQIFDLASLSNEKQKAVRAVFAHEYGHFTFLKLTAAFSKSEQLRFLRDLSELQNETNPDQQHLQELSDQFKEFQTPYNYELMAAYNELFADMVASSLAQNPDEIFESLDLLFGRRPTPEHRCRSMRSPLGLCQEINDPHVWLSDIRKSIWDYHLQGVFTEPVVLGRELTGIAQIFVSEIEYFLDQQSDRFTREKAVQRLRRFF